MKKQKCILVAGGNNSSAILIQHIGKGDFLVGIDKGAIFFLQHNFVPNLAIGDFDSVSQKELQLIKKKAKEIKILKKEKDDTDTELALKAVIKKGYDDITILGGIGTRIDHALANVLLLEKYQKSGRQIKIIDKNNQIEMVIKKKIITKNPNLPNISLISLTDYSVISLTGFKYPLKNKKVKRGETLCISNELIEKQGMVGVSYGRVLMIKSRD